MAQKKRASGATHVERPRLCVLAGGPCSGKTALAEALARRGAPTVPEAFTDLLDAGFDGRLLDIERFHFAIAEHQRVQEEQALARHPRRLIYCDRGLGDPLGYMLHHGHAPSRRLTELLRRSLYHYRLVFALALNPSYRRTRRRPEPRAAALRIQERIVQVYRQAGARLVWLPWGSLEWRAERVLSLARRWATLGSSSSSSSSWASS